MALPANVNFGTVTGRFIDSEGANIEGRVTFTPQPKSLLNISAEPPTTILPRPVTANLSSGAFSVQLIATDDPDNNPAGWTYQVTFNFTGVSLGAFAIAVPQDSTVDLSVVAPVASTSGTIIIRGPGVPESAADGDTVVFDAGTGKWVAAAPTGGGGGAVASVNGQTGAVVLVPSDVGAQPAGSYVSAADLSDGLASKANASHTHSTTEVTGLTAALGGKSDVSHTHVISDTTGLQAALDAAGGTPSWSDVTGKPSTFAPSIGATSTTAVAGNDARLTDARTPKAHTHATADVTGLDTALAGKQATGDYATNTALTTGLAGKAATSHTHTIANVTGLQTALDAKGTSNLAIGTTGTTAKAGNYTPTIADLPAKTVLYVDVTTGSETRPTARTDVKVIWVGGTVTPTNKLTGDIWFENLGV